MANSLRIAHLGVAALPIPHPLGGAIQRRMLELARAQAARGHTVVLYSAGERARRTTLDGVEIRTLACRRRMPLRDIEYMRKAIAEVTAEPADLLHFHSLPEGATLARGLGAKTILSFDNFFFRRGKRTPLFWWYRRALRRFSCLLPVSQFCRRGFQHYWQTDPAPIHVLHNGVNLDQFTPDPVRGAQRRRALGIAEDQKVVLYVGRVCHQKGTDILIEAFARLRETMSDVRLVVAGPSEQFGSLAGTALTRRISEVGGLYLGPVDESILPSVYNMGDIFVMPTRELEMFGMAALEAQACGKPVISSEHGGLPEVISPASGLFFPPGRADALEARLRKCLVEDGLRRSLAEMARNNASRFAWPGIARRIEEIYHAC
ncbi:MAG: glycosyltransferase family 4 protein [Acidobacteriota bacterium]|nr:glycosyltransferase family 4 protein [Acidobacteriota bacterium]